MHRTVNRPRNTPITHAQSVKRSLIPSSTAFRPTLPAARFTRIIDTTLSTKNQQARGEEAPKHTQNPLTELRKVVGSEEAVQLLSEAEAIAGRHKARVERKMRTKDAVHPFTAYDFTVTIVGRPNVGKSSLFNRLTGQSKALVHGSSGVTRDWNDSMGSIANLNFRIIDTAGLEDVDFSVLDPTHTDADTTRFKQHKRAKSEPGTPFGAPVAAEKRSGKSDLLEKKRGGKAAQKGHKGGVSNFALGRPLTPELQQSILDLTQRAIALSDIVIFVIDSQQGVTMDDIHFSRWIRRSLNAKPQSTQNINHVAINTASEKIRQALEEHDNDLRAIDIDSIFSEFKLDFDAIEDANHTSRQLLRTVHSKPVIVVANKFDYGNSIQAHGHNVYEESGQLKAKQLLSTPEETLYSESYRLGFSDPVPFSAIHGVGIGELYSKLVFSMSNVLRQWDIYQKNVQTVIDTKKKHTKLLKQDEKKQLQDEMDRKKIKKSKTAASKTSTLGLSAGSSHVDESSDDDEERIKKTMFDEYESASTVIQSKKQQKKQSKMTSDSEVDDLDYDDYDDDKMVDSGDESFYTESEGEHPRGKVLDDSVISRELAGELPLSMDASRQTEERENHVKIVIAGRPNVGKSTLINSILGEKRLLTGPQAGVTRDSISIAWHHDSFPNHSFEIMDTAGVKGVTKHKHSRFDYVDSTAMQTTVRNIQNAHVVILVLDIAEGLYGNAGVDPIFTQQIHRNFIQSVKENQEYDAQIERAKAKGADPTQLNILLKQHKAEKSAYDDKLSMMVQRVSSCVTKGDLDIARLAAEHGKALLVVANKIDCLRGGDKEVQAVMKGLLALFNFSFGQTKGVTVMPISALQSRNIEQITAKAAQLYDSWNSRINTGLLNRWLRALTVLSPPPHVNKKPLNLKYITQTNQRPPTFALFTNIKKDFPEHYQKFLTNSLIDEFNLHGVPIRVNVRTADNPFVDNNVKSEADKIKVKRKRAKEAILEKKQKRHGKNHYSRFKY